MKKRRDTKCMDCGQQAPRDLAGARWMEGDCGCPVIHLICPGCAKKRRAS